MAAAPAPLVLLATQPGCFIFGSPGPSAVGQGHKYVSGNPEYDQYFSQLYDVQVEMANAPATEKTIRSKLAKDLGIDAEASASLIARKVKKEAAKLEKQGTGIKINLSGGDDDEGASAKLETSGKALSGDGKKFADAVQDALEHEAKLAAQMKKSRKLLDQLRAQAIGLKANVKTVFRKGGLRKQSEVNKNLKDADSIITLMVARADQVTDSAKETIKRLSDAIETDHGQFNAPAPPPPEDNGQGEDEKEKKPEKTKPHWHPPAHQGGAAPPAHKPPPKKKESPPPSDFEP